MHMHTLYLVVMEGLTVMMTFEQTLEGVEGKEPCGHLGENIPVRGSSAKALKQEHVYSVHSHLLSHEVSFSKFKKIQFIKNMLSDHIGHKLK